MQSARLIFNIALALVSAWWLCARPALASACREEIARLEQRLRDAKTNPADQPTGNQSIGAQLGHQPTPESVAEAELRADEAVQAILNRAKAFDAESKANECEKAVTEAKLHFGP
jgi:hypothetical protein